jgi:hypothetical protein
VVQTVQAVQYVFFEQEPKERQDKSYSGNSLGLCELSVLGARKCLEVAWSAVLTEKSKGT